MKRLLFPAFVATLLLIFVMMRPKSQDTNVIVKASETPRAIITKLESNAQAATKVDRAPAAAYDQGQGTPKPTMEDLHEEFDKNPDRISALLSHDYESYRSSLNAFYQSELQLNYKQVEQIEALNSKYHADTNDLSVEAGVEVVAGQLFGVMHAEPYLAEVEKIIGHDNFEKAQRFKEEYISKLAREDKELGPLFSCCIVPKAAVN